MTDHKIGSREEWLAGTPTSCSYPEKEHTRQADGSPAGGASCRG